MFAAIGGFLGESILMKSPVGEFLKAVPRWAWEVLALVVLVLAGLVWFHHQLNAAFSRGQEAEAASVEVQALQIKSAADALSTNISNLIRSTTDAENSRIYVTADAIRLRGPGRAACPGSTIVPAAASGPQPSDGSSGTPVARVPYPQWDELLGLPFTPTVNFAEQHDLNRAEALAWRDWYQRELSAWPRSQPVPPLKKHRTLLQRLTPW